MTLDDVYRETIIEHSQHPRNKRALEGATAHARGYNPFCGDDVTVYVRLAAGEPGRLEEATFTGRSCSICEASASMLTQAVSNRPVSEVQALSGAVRAYLTSRDADAPEELGELEALGGVRKFPTRVKCATLGWNALEQALAEAGAPRGGE